MLALQTIVARNVDPSQPAVVSCTEIHTDGARNAIPGEVVLTGDTRSFDAGRPGAPRARMRALCEGICAAHGATCTVTYTHEFEPTVNDAGLHSGASPQRWRSSARTRRRRLPAVMGSEDFGVFGRRGPVCFAFLGNGTEPGAGGTPLHSRDYDFNDDVLETGVKFYVELVRSVLPARAGA